MPEYSLTGRGLISRLDQPVLIVQNGEVVDCNGAAEKLLCGIKPVLRECMLPEAMEAYSAYNGEGSLLLSMRLGGNRIDFTVYREAGSDIFLSVADGDEGSCHILERTAQMIHRAVHEIYDAHNAQLPESKVYEDPSVRKAVSRINKAICRLERLAGNLADYSTLRGNRHQPRFERLELVNTFCRLCERMQDMFRDYEIVFHSEYRTMMGQVDRPLLERAVLNLMTNALRTMNPGGRLEMQVIRLGGNRAAFRIQDDGEGIDPQCMSGVMHAAGLPASPLDDPRLGVGLGLSLCMEIARLHGGTLVLQSTPGQGTQALLSFSLALPDISDGNLLRFDIKGMDPFLIEISDLLPPEAFFDI